MDGLVGPCSADAPHGDPRDPRPSRGLELRFCVIVDDCASVDLVVRGRDLLHATPAQIRLGQRLGRETPPAYLHHRLIRRPDGSKLSKSSGDTGVRELRASGHSPAEVISMAEAAVGYVDGGGEIGTARVERGGSGVSHTQ
jgi:glutamyl-Q tRNA(Asp) synthetase